ncbi:MAG: hypothetical protein U1C19_00130 [Methanobacteriaceae archaeon]|nr:hypothetical protein [Methanobacteriaceae archaeon]
MTVKTLYIAAAGYGDSQGDYWSLEAVFGKHGYQLDYLIDSLA